MKWVLIALAVVVVLVLVVVVVGFLLPVKHTASRTASFPVPPEKLWQVITTIPELPSWRKGLGKVEVLPDRNGHVVWRETDSSGSAITFEVIEADAPKKLVTRIADTDLAFGGSWTYEIVPAAAGSQLTITENGEVYNPIFRFVSRFIMGHHATIDTYLESLRVVAR
jgi:uncharacterized protein YndB with AHSA1/START domain